jgi:hypothetical protein
MNAIDRDVMITFYGVMARSTMIMILIKLPLPVTHPTVEVNYLLALKSEHAIQWHLVAVDL